MYDFPNSPALNQVVTGPGGSQYRWDGTKWLAYPVPAQPLPPTFNDVGRNLTTAPNATNAFFYAVTTATAFTSRLHPRQETGNGCT
jgi:hypothetical protein